MFRKTIIAIAATAALGAAALAPTAASAGWKGNHHHGHHFRHFYGFNYVYGGCFWKKRWVETDYGMVRRWVKVCY